MKIDAEIASVAVVDPVNSVTITLATSIGTPMISGGMIEVHRDTAVFQFPQITITNAKDRTVVLDLSKMETYPTNVKKLAQTFFDDRVYPCNDLMVRVADPNANGTLGASLGIKLLVPGDPMKSFVLLRLIDPNQGELMPLACRQWNDAATRALGCWIKGLKVDDKGNALNAEDPIDYASCDFKPDGMGRCSASTATGFAGVQAVFSRSCGGSGCHLNEMTPGGLLDLSEGKALASLVDVPSGQSSMKRVVPGNPDASYIMCKISPDCANRKLERMPKGGLALNPADIEVVRAWIASGAKAE